MWEKVIANVPKKTGSIMKYKNGNPTESPLREVFLQTLKKQIEYKYIEVKDYVTLDSIALSFVEDLEKYDKSQEKLQAFNTIIELLDKHFPDKFLRLMEDMKNNNT